MSLLSDVHFQESAQIIAQAIVHIAAEAPCVILLQQQMLKMLWSQARDAAHADRYAA